jgi:protein PET117
MSRRAQATLLGAVLISSFTIWGVHFQQDQERENMYKGVLRDDERRREKKRQREEALHESLRKREIYERVQKIDSGNENS